VGLDLGAARERVRVARALGTLPRLAQALARGELSYAKVRALTRVATPETEERLLAVGRAGTADHVERIVRGWRRVDRKAEAVEAARRHASRALHVYQDEDGMVTLRGRLAPEVGAVLMQALAAAREAIYERTREKDANTSPVGVSEETPTVAQQQADALALLAETALHHGIDPGVPGERYQVVVHVDAPALADPDQPGQSVLEWRTRFRGNVAAPGVRREPGGDAARSRWACRGGCCPYPHDSPGASAGAPSPRPRLPLPGLRAPVRSVTSHPSLGTRGPTTLSNLALLCRRHHRAVHEEGYQVDRQPDGELRFRRPDGRLLSEIPRPPEIPSDAVKVLRARHDGEGLVLHARTATPRWLGERLDVGWAIDVLHPLALPSAISANL